MALKKITSALLAATLSLTSLFVSTGEASAQAESKGGCKPYGVLVLPGTGETERGSTQKIGMLQNVTTPLGVLAPGQFLIQSVDYPASAGGLIAPVYGRKAPFADSVKTGIDLTLKYAAEYKSRCPGIKFAIIGYSQGAMVAGDVAEIIGNGKSGDITADDIIGVLMYADPRRAPNYINGKQVQRVGSEKTINGLGQKPEGQGIFGYRKEYGKLTSRSVSFCNQEDIVCNTSNQARPAADWLAAVAEYNTGSNYKQLVAYQEAGFGRESRKVANMSTEGDQFGDPATLIQQRAQNPASLAAMLAGFADIGTQAIKDDPVAAFSEALSLKTQDNSDTKEALLRKGFRADSMSVFLAELAKSGAVQGHLIYPIMPVDSSGTTATQWGANWLAARMN